MAAARLATLLALASSVVAASIFPKASRQECRPITAPLCRDLPYNLTMHPSALTHTDDARALEAQLDHFRPLIKTRCNPHIKFFVCSVFVPMCPPNLPQAVSSCRSVCEEVKRDCERILTEFDIEWPTPLNCSKFNEEPALCMQPVDNAHDGEPPQPSPPSSPPAAASSNERDSNIEQHHDSHSFEPIAAVTIPSCPGDLLNLDPTDAHGSCALPCEQPIIFKKDEVQTASSWLLAASSAGGVVTLLVVLTFLVDRERFPFPDRAIFYMALCALLSTLPNLSRIVLSYEQTACDHLPGTRRPFLVLGGLNNTICVLSFLLSYYFALAGGVWWLMLTFTWYLAAARKWVQEEIEKRANHLHAIAWGAPSLAALSILITQKVDASELFGICSVGNLNPWTLLIYVLVPRVLALAFGGALLVATFASMCTERRAFQYRGIDTSKLEKLMLKMGSFSALYALPTFVLILCELYHLLVLLRWYPATIDCKQSGGDTNCQRPKLTPRLDVYLAHLVAALACGAATGVWVCAPKTLRSWQRFVCCRRVAAPALIKQPLATRPTVNGSGSGGGASTTTYIAVTNSHHQHQPQPPPLLSHAPHLLNGHYINNYIPLSMVATSNAQTHGRPSFTSDGWKPPNAL